MASILMITKRFLRFNLCVAFYKLHVSFVHFKAFEIEDKDKLTVSIEGTALKVTWELLSVKPSGSDWIGIYKSSEENNKQYVTFKYIDPKQNWMLLNVPEQSGSYQVRYFTN